jgi:hypothetical protein
MDLIISSQHDLIRTPERQLEIDQSQRSNLKHSGISRLVPFSSCDEAPVPQGTVLEEEVSGAERITHVELYQREKRQGSITGPLQSADICMDEGLEHRKACFNRPDASLWLTDYKPFSVGFRLNDYPHWTQNVWDVLAYTETCSTPLLEWSSSTSKGSPDSAYTTSDKKIKKNSVNIRFVVEV